MLSSLSIPAAEYLVLRRSSSMGIRPWTKTRRLDKLTSLLVYRAKKKKGEIWYSTAIFSRHVLLTTWSFQCYQQLKKNIPPPSPNPLSSFPFQTPHPPPPLKCFCRSGSDLLIFPHRRPLLISLTLPVPHCLDLFVCVHGSSYVRYFCQAR